MPPIRHPNLNPGHNRRESFLLDENGGIVGSTNALDITFSSTHAVHVMNDGSVVSSTNPLYVSPHSINQSYINDGKQGYSVVHKFGRNAAVGTSYVPLCLGGTYQTVQADAAQLLRVKAGSSVDTSTGAGARELTLEGLSSDGSTATSVLATAGLSASAASTQAFIRLFRYYVSGSGTYATFSSTGSHSGDLVIENSTGAGDWATIGSTGGMARSQSQIGAYTIPLNKTGYINGFFVTVDSNKAFDLAMFRRDNILQTSAPYSAMRIQTEIVGLKDPMDVGLRIPSGPFPELTDLIWAAKVSAGTADISIDFEILLKDS